MNPAALRRLGVMLREMWGHGSPRLGKVAYDAVADGAAEGETAGEAAAREESAGEGSVGEEVGGEEIVLRRALRDLGEAAERVGSIGEVRGRLDERVRELAGRVHERRDYRLIHGELGPDHVLLDEQGEPVIIDIEGLMYFDLEWEHVFLRLRFGDRYHYLETRGLDEHRMRFYALATHLSLVAGPLRLLDGDFPRREGMLEIVRYNTDRVLEGLA